MKLMVTLMVNTSKNPPPKNKCTFHFLRNSFLFIRTSCCEKKPPNAALQRRAIPFNLHLNLLPKQASTESAASACSARLPMIPLNQLLQTDAQTELRFDRRCCG